MEFAMEVNKTVGELMKNLGRLAVPVAAAVFALTTPLAHADLSFSSYLEYDNTGLPGPDGRWGLVTLTETGFNGSVYTQMNVSVNLSDYGTKFINTSSTHDAFVFNLSLPSASGLTITNLTSGFSVDPSVPVHEAPFSANNSPYFTTGIICDICGNGATNPNSGPLTFTVTDANGISVGPPIGTDPNTSEQFISSDTGWWFAADLYHLAPGGNTLITGNIGARDFITSPVPEPEIYSMLATGLGLLGWFGRRKIPSVGRLA